MLESRVVAHKIVTGPFRNFKVGDFGQIRSHHGVSYNCGYPCILIQAEGEGFGQNLASAKWASEEEVEVQGRAGRLISIHVSSSLLFSGLLNSISLKLNAFKQTSISSVFS